MANLADGQTENISAQWLPRIDPQLCNGCGLCIDLCPNDVLGWDGEVAALTAPERCNYCATCETVCPPGAIELPYLICKAAL